MEGKSSEVNCLIALKRPDGEFNTCPTYAAEHFPKRIWRAEAKRCEETAKKRGFKGDDRAAFVSSCMAARDTAAATMSPEDQQKADKAKSCEQQADQQGLKGKDRKAFVNICTGK